MVVTKPAEIEVTITVTDVNDAPMFSEAMVTREIVENQTGNVGAPVTAMDDDTGNSPNLGSISTYTLSGPDADSFMIDSNGQLTTADGVEVDYETKSVYMVMVTAMDAGGLTDTITVRIEVTDVEEGPGISQNRWHTLCV